MSRGAVVTDLRNAVRFPLKLPITIRTGDAHEHFAETADISAGGVLFHMNTEIAIGTIIKFRIVLPAAVLGTDTDVLVNCTGRVVRCMAGDAKTGSKKGVAAVIDEYSFERVFSHAG